MHLRIMTSLALATLVACSSGGDDASPQATTPVDHAELKLAAVQYKDNKALLFAGSGEHKEFMAQVVPAVASWFD